MSNMRDTQQMISVIVPVYNVETYLSECLDSILSQNYDALEIILINDGSRDGSGKICDNYAAKDSRIRVIHQQNGGAAAAKNAGLRIATGTYLSFVDSDDYLEPGAYEYMVGLLEESGADVVQCAFRKLFISHSEDMILHPGRRMETAESALMRFLEGWTSAILWNKLYKRSVFDGIFFEEGHVIDDEFFTYQGIMNAKKVMFDDRIIYNYRIRRSSVMNLPQLELRRLLDQAECMDQRRKKVGQRFPALKKRFEAEYLYSLCQMSGKPCNTQDSIRLLQEKTRDYFHQGGRGLPGVRSLPRLLWLCFGSAGSTRRFRKEVPAEIDMDSLYP